MKIASALTLSLAVVGAALLMPASPANSQSQVDNAIPADMATRFTGKAGTVCGKVGKARFAENAAAWPYPPRNMRTRQIKRHHKRNRRAHATAAWLHPPFPLKKHDRPSPGFRATGARFQRRSRTKVSAPPGAPTVAGRSTASRDTRAR